MRIGVIGTGYVGLVTGVCFAELGYDVTCMDRDKTKIQQLQQGSIPFFEPGLETFLTRNQRADRLHFADNMHALAAVDILFLAVGTPSDANGKADLSMLRAATKEALEVISPKTLLVIKSTVPPGTNEALTLLAQENGAPDIRFASNPEFLREGSAIQDCMQPDRIVVGVGEIKSEQQLRELYAPLGERGIPLCVTSIRTAELIKYASNAYLAMRLAFINEMADMCEASRADITELAQGVGLDKRIGTHYFQPGPGFGGSCFPKDTRGMQSFAKGQKVPLPLLDAVITSNEARIARMADKVITSCGGNIKHTRLAVLGAAFKGNTDDVRESPALLIIKQLLQQGAQIEAFDPEAETNAKHWLQEQVEQNHLTQEQLKQITWHDDAYCTMHQASALVILTEWEQFATLDLQKVATHLLTPRLIDLRNLYIPSQVHAAGLEYICIGKATPQNSGGL